MDTRERDFRTGELEERRTEERHKALRGARILFNGGYGALECLVRNESETGAKLAFGDGTAVPNRFSLYVPGTAQRREVTVQWRRDGDVGVRVA